MDLQDDLDAPDEAIDSWGDNALTHDLHDPATGRTAHVPFYRTLHYPDVLDLRRSGYEIADFAPLLDELDGALVSQARTVHHLLHQPGGNAIWNPYRARQIEFSVRAALHRFGKSDAPIMLRRMMGRCYPGDTLTHYAIDLLNVFFWAAMAKMARDLAWRSPQLAAYADYLEYPVRVAFGHSTIASNRAA